MSGRSDDYPPEALAGHGFKGTADDWIDQASAAGMDPVVVVYPSCERALQTVLERVDVSAAPQGVMSHALMREIIDRLVELDLVEIVRLPRTIEPAMH